MRLLLALALVGVTAHGAVAAPVYCKLLTDVGNDVTLGSAPYADPALDVRSADVVSDNTGVGVTLRLGALPMQPASAAGTDLAVPDLDYKVFLTFRSSGNELIFDVRAWGGNALGAAAGASGGAAGSGWHFEAGRYLNDSLHEYSDRYFARYGDAAGVVDPARQEIRASVTWADLKRWGYSRVKGDVATNVRVLARDVWLSSTRDPEALMDRDHVLYDTSPRDEASTTRAYPFGARTCTTRG